MDKAQGFILLQADRFLKGRENARRVQRAFKLHILTGIKIEVIKAKRVDLKVKGVARVGPFLSRRIIVENIGIILALQRREHGDIFLSGLIGRGIDQQYAGQVLQP